MKIKFGDFSRGHIPIQELRADDVFVDPIKLEPIPDMLVIHKGHVQFLTMDGADYVAIVKVPPGCDTPTYLLMPRSDIVAIANYINRNTAEDTDEKIQDL